jgi:hypothetical protein
LRPNDPRVLNGLGVAYDWLGRFDLSTRYYDLANAADPGSKIVALNRRYSLMLQRHGGAVVAHNIFAPEDAPGAGFARGSRPQPIRTALVGPLPTVLALNRIVHGG